MAAYYISDWQIHKDGIRTVLKMVLNRGDCKITDYVWRGPAGDAVIASDPAELDEEYAEYMENGQVEDYL